MSRPPETGESGVVAAEPDRVGQLFDLVSYVVAVVGVFTVVSVAGALALGEPLAPSVKYGFFVLGWLTFGYATLLLLPSKPWNDENNAEEMFADPGTEDGDSEFQVFVQELPPARFRQLEPERRLPTGARLFVAALVVLGASIVLETVFGVGP
ncbi:MAG: hypothetical protein ABEH83_01805 [Halobacterium sp.]